MMTPDEETGGGSVEPRYRLKAIATVVFDIDSGQRLDALYPESCSLSEEAKKSIAHLALPHSNNQDEGDTQFIVRFPESTNAKTFLYGFVLFRQQRDESRSRGYFQKSLVLVCDKPYVDLYDRVLRVIGPLFFQVGKHVLQAVYENIHEWPDPVYGSPMVLPLAGTYISCVIPDLIDYNHTEAADFYANDSPTSASAEHYIVDSDEPDSVTSSQSPDVEEEHDGDDDQSDEESVLVKGGKFVVANRTRPPAPSFGDLLIAKRTEPVTAFENIGLYSSFVGVESTLWLLWQMALTGESFLILSPHARTCSQAALAFTSLIAPLQYMGDCRPYFALYEADFDEISRRHSDLEHSSQEKTTVIGTTNPFFMKSFRHWPNALVFPFLEPSKAKESKTGPSEGENDDGGDDRCRIVRLKNRTALDKFDSSDRAMLLRRCSRYVVPDATVIRQLVSPPEVYVTQTASLEDEPYAAINNAVLRRHFRKLTKRFLQPFQPYFGISKASSTSSNLYMSAADYMKPFDLQKFLRTIKPRKLPPQIKPSRWKRLYTAFVESPNFRPWFDYRRALCIFHFADTLRAMRESVSSSLLLKTALGKPLSKAQCLQLQHNIKIALEVERARTAVDKALVRAMEKHLKAVDKQLKKTSR